jgi:poly(3-hydroxybutyrate) depolymerase
VITLVLIVWLSSLAVMPQPHPVVISQTTDTPKGQIVERIVCSFDPAQTYALYLPSSYSTEKEWPVLYVFDPGARGKIPAERFREPAEKYGWIVVASNNSRNGPMQPSIEAWNAMVKDTHARFSIDDERVYVAGMSGAARLATYLASRCSDCAAGVIACSAGFPVGVNPSPAWHFALFSTAGIDDFNLAEVKATEEPLTKAGVSHRTEVFAGRHEWAPSSVMTEGLEWMELQAMKTRKRPRDENLIESTWQRKLQQAGALEDAKQIYDAYRIYLTLVDTYTGLRDVGAAEKKISQLRDSANVRNAIRDEQQQIRKQREMENTIGALLAAQEQTTEDAANEGLGPEMRLRGTFAELRKRAGQTKDTGERRVARRVLEGTFILLFEQGTNQLQTQKRFAAAIRTFTWATELNPDRAGPFFYLAWAYAAQGDKKQALRALQTAADKGFSDVAAITGNKVFDLVRDDKQYQPIIRTVESKH